MARPRAQRRRWSAGFTLVEVIVVVGVLGLAAGVVALTLPAREDAAETAARAFARTLDRAADQAIISGLPVGVRITARGYAFAERRFNRWLPLSADPFAPAAWPETVFASVIRTEAESRARREQGARAQAVTRLSPDIRFDPTGGATAFEVAIASAERSVTVRAGSDGRIRVERDDGG
ncbi:MAG: type II secretion system minor pseudopilin GspH [Maricaulaceae bacterium]